MSAAVETGNTVRHPESGLRGLFSDYRTASEARAQSSRTIPDARWKVDLPRKQPTGAPHNPCSDGQLPIVHGYLDTRFYGPGWVFDYHLRMHFG